MLDRRGEGERGAGRELIEWAVKGGLRVVKLPRPYAIGVSGRNTLDKTAGDGYFDFKDSVLVGCT